jgi:hypothetical protein
LTLRGALDGEKILDDSMREYQAVCARHGKLRYRAQIETPAGLKELS